MSRTSEDVLGSKVGMITVGVMPVATALSILTSTANWSTWGYWSEFFADFNRWPWIRTSLLMAMVTFVAAAANGRKQSEDDQWLIYGMFQVPFILALVYPRAFGTSGGENIVPLLALTIIIHEVAHNVLRSEARRAMMERTEQNRTDPY